MRPLTPLLPHAERMVRRVRLPAGGGTWILLGVFGLALFLCIRTVRSRRRDSASTALRNAPSWLGPLNSLNMVLGPFAILLAGLPLGGVNLLSLLAAASLFFAGLTGQRYFRLRPVVAKSAALTANVVAVLLGSLALLADNTLTSERFGDGDQGPVRMVTVALPALPVMVSLATAVVIVRRSESPR